MPCKHIIPNSPAKSKLQQFLIIAVVIIYYNIYYASRLTADKPEEGT